MAMDEDDDEDDDSDEAWLKAFFKWMPSCKYQCQLCNSQYSTAKREQFIAHISRRHGASADQYRLKFGTLEQTKSEFQCLKCSEMVLCEEQAIRIHAQSHDLSVEGLYKAKCRKRAIKKVNPIRKIVQDNFQDWQCDDHHMLLALRKASQAMYWCKDCKNFKTPKWHTIRDHMDKVCHRGDKAEEVIIYSQFHACMICQKMFTPGKLEPHLSRSHSMDLQSYYEQHLKSTYTMSADDMRTEAYKWGNRCLYSCKCCKKFTTTDNKSFFKHLKFTHRISSGEYTNTYGTQRTEKVVHKCKLCGNTILHDTLLLKKHYTFVHHSSLPEYYQNHILNTDDAHIDVSAQQHQEKEGKLDYDIIKR